MATSTISKIAPTVTADAIGFTSNTSLFSVQNLASRRYGNIVQFRVVLGTKSQINAGTTVTVGTLSGSVPAITTYILAYRESAEMQCGTAVLPTSEGDITLNVLSSIASGVTIVIAGTYICN